MRQLFADTFYFLALLHEKDEAHQRAVQLTARGGLRILTTLGVLTEVGDYLGAIHSRQRFEAMYRSLQAEGAVTIVAQDGDVFEKALNLYFQRRDKAWSLTDCTSFVRMREHSISEALTGDHHFEQAGFVALLR